jgi:hypothetical protein
MSNSDLNDSAPVGQTSMQFQVPYDARGLQFVGGVDHALDATAVVGAAVAVEVPPGNAPLGGDHWRGQGSAQRRL